MRRPAAGVALQAMPLAGLSLADRQLLSAGDLSHIFTRTEKGILTMKPSLALAALGIGLATPSAAASQPWWLFDYRYDADMRGHPFCVSGASVIPKENGTPASFYEAREHDPADGRPLHPQLIDKGEEVDVIADLVPLGGGPATDRVTSRFFRTKEACVRGAAEEEAEVAAEAEAAKRKARALDKYR